MGKGTEGVRPLVAGNWKMNGLKAALGRFRPSRKPSRVWGRSLPMS